MIEPQEKTATVSNSTCMGEQITTLPPLLEPKGQLDREMETRMLSFEHWKQNHSNSTNVWDQFLQKISYRSKKQLGIV